MTYQELMGNLKPYLIGVVIVALALLPLNYSFTLGWLMGNLISVVNIVLRDMFYDRVFRIRHFNGWLYFLYFTIQVSLLALSIVVAIITRWMNVYTLFIGFLFYKYAFIYFKGFKKVDKTTLND